MRDRDPERREAALQAAALAVSSAQGEEIFRELTRTLAAVLGVETALIGRLADKTPRTIQTLGIYGSGGYRENIEYPLDVTPCSAVIGGEFCVVPRDVSTLFAKDPYLPGGAVAYAGYPLRDAAGRPAGVIAVFSGRPIEDAGLFESVLKIFAVRAAAEIERRSHEANYRAIFEASEDAIFIHDCGTGAILDVNPKAASAYGYTREELRRMSVGDISGNEPPYTDAEAKRLIGEVRDGRGPLRFEWLRRNKDGSLHWDEVTLKRVDIAGKPHVLAMNREITERKAAVEALRASEGQYRAIFNAAADSMVLRDAAFRIVDVNPAYERMSGRAREEVLGRDGLTMSPPELNEHVKRLHARALAGEAVLFEARARRQDGSRFDIETRGVPILHQGQPHVLYIGRDITARKTEEELLRASEQQYRAIFDASADALVLWDSKLRRVDVNPAYERIYGFSREEVLAPAYAEQAAPEYAERRRDLVRRTLAGERCQVELESARKDGTRIQVEVRTIPIQHRGRPHVLAISRDITERKRAEAAVRASEEQYRAVFNASVDGMLLWDAGHRVVDVNDAFVRMHGYGREEVLGQTQPVFIPGDLQAQCAALLPRVLAGESCSFEGRSLRKDGSLFDVEMHGVPMHYQGRPHVLVIVRDVTSRRQAEDRLRASEERYRLLFEMESDAIVLVDVETLQHLDVNRAAVELYGYSRGELLALKSTDLSAEDEKTRSAMQKGAAQAGMGFVRVPLRYHRKKDGTVFPVEITANFFALHGRRIMLAAIRDITERKQAEEARAQLEAQLRQAQKMEAIGQLTGGVAHDFNNILQSILGNLTLAGERVEELADARLARYLERAQLSAQRARELIQQMLTFSRGTRGEPRVLPLAPLVAQAVKLLRPTLPSTIEVRLELDDEAPPVKVDPVQAEQVLLNLCINARDAMSGAGTLALAVRHAPDAQGVCAGCRQRFAGRFVELAVRDTGSGIAPEIVDRMFEPFFSTKEVGKGSGMGLSMVHGIVHEHGGHVSVESAPGEGAAFRVLLPEALGVVAAGEKRLPPGARPELSGRVLVVDDEQMILEVVGDLLAGWGLEVTLKSSGVEAKHAFAAEPQRYDLVLTDYTMPRVTGLELARQIRGIRPGTPVVLYTGYGEDIAEAELAVAGVRALARKPVEPAELFALLKTHLIQNRNTVK
jgi:PAS domain S-box-containing protein